MGFEKVGIGHVDCLHASDERTKSNIKGRDRIDRGFSHRWICWRDFGSMVLMSAVRKKGNRWSMSKVVKIVILTRHGKPHAKSDRKNGS
jgi:hypothetical protein